jgi:hypothetical protein
MSNYQSQILIRQYPFNVVYRSSYQPSHSSSSEGSLSSSPVSSSTLPYNRHSMSSMFSTDENAYFASRYHQTQDAQRQNLSRKDNLLR